jgi:hypothetical protein
MARSASPLVSASAIGDRVDLVQEARRFAQQLGAGLGDAGLARAAVEQQHVERVLDLPNPVAQCARHEVERARRAGKAAGVGHGLQHGERVGGQYVSGAGHGGSIN